MTQQALRQTAAQLQQEQYDHPEAWTHAKERTLQRLIGLELKLQLQSRKARKAA